MSIGARSQAPITATATATATRPSRRAAAPDMLDGFCIGVTADRRWEEQAALFRRRGATVVHARAIRILPFGADEGLRRATEDVIARRPRYVIANTGIGIRSWFAAAESWGIGCELTAALRAATIVARGAKASAAVHHAGLEVTCRAATERFCETVDLVLAGLEPGDAVAVQRDGGPAPGELDRLRAAGAHVVEVPAYEWRLPEDCRPAVRLAEAVIAGRVHAVTFTAGPQVRNWFAIAAEHDLDRALLRALSTRVVLGCVGPVCAESAHALGMPAERLVVPQPTRLGPLVRAVADHLYATAPRVPVGDRELVLTGTVARVGDRRVILTDTESRIMERLVVRPGAVVTKAHLLGTVWGKPDGDPHVVEVSVGRLRRRLDPLGVRVEAVTRRGYRLDV
jgi:uroporphyrinogen-III synthase